ncbi:MAG: hypothetical protein IKE36_07035 [Solobacterium sp.]|nr:hypothetical protein [Solobacterium sp.]
MSTTMYAIIGLIMMLSLTGLCISGKVTPMVAMISIPLIVCVICRFAPADISSWIASGLQGQVNNVTMFTFAIIFFGIMSDVGVFDKMVSKLIKLCGNNVVLVTVITVVVAIIGHADGSGATTYMIAIPPLLAIYKKLNMRPELLMTLVALTIGIMNVVPWGGPCGRLAAGFGLEAMDIWLYGLPLMFFGLACTFVYAVILGRKEIKRGAGLISTAEEEDVVLDPEKEALKRPNLFWFNCLLIVLVFVCLFTGILPITASFMLGSVLGLLVNYPDPKMQGERLKSYAPSCLAMTSILLAAGVYTGILNNSPIKAALVEKMTALIPTSATAHLNTILLFALAPMIFLGFDLNAMCYTIGPIIAEMVAVHGIPALVVASTINTAWEPVNMFGATGAAMYIGLGLAGVEYKDHVRFGVKWGFLTAFLSGIFALLIGLYPL